MYFQRVTSDIGMKLYSSGGLSLLHQDVLKAALLFHDIGKATYFFQDKLHGNFEHNEVLTRHSEFSALFCLYYLLSSGVEYKESLLAFCSVKKHHGNFDNIEESLYVSEDVEKNLDKITSAIDFEELNKIYSSYFNINLINKSGFLNWYNSFHFGKLRRKLKKDLTGKSLNLYNKLNLYFSVLVYSDKQDCIFNRDFFGGLQPKLNFACVDEFKKEKFNDFSRINKIREEAYLEVEKNIKNPSKIMSINLPTGSGKTLTVFNAALKLLENDDSLEKIIYCLPFTSVIDQNSDVFENVLKTMDGMTISTQHHLTEINTRRYDKNNKKEVTDNQAEYLIETWQSKIVVTTFYQLLHTMLSGSNKQLKKYNKLMNSIIILDEVQSIPREYWELIKRVFVEFSELFSIRIILVTATMPLIFSEEKNEIKELAESKKEYFKLFNRISLDVSILSKKINIDDFCVRILSEIKEKYDKSFLIILNTIGSSIAIYNCLKDAGFSPLYLSSNVIPIDRMKIINQIRGEKTKQIVVSTQVVEAGVDIDFDVVYRDIAPLDSVFQACGRCNRTGSDNKGMVRLFDLISETGKRYAEYVYDKLSLNKTFEVLSGKSVIEEKDFFSLSNEYYFVMKNITETKTSGDIYKYMSCLNYNKAFYNKDSFELIKQEYKTIPVFICIDLKAEKLLEEYKDLLPQLINGKNNFDFKVKLKNHFKKMQKYMLSIPQRYIDNESEENFIVINREQIPSEYNPRTGFVRSPHHEDYFM